MRTIRHVAMITAAVLAISSASAKQEAVPPQLTEVKGRVLVDSGKGFAPVSGPVALKLGDRVAVPGGGEAVLSYGPECSMPLSGPSVTTVIEAGCVVGTQGNSQDGANDRCDEASQGERRDPACALPLWAFTGPAGVGLFAGLASSGGNGKADPDPDDRAVSAACPPGQGQGNPPFCPDDDD